MVESKSEHDVLNREVLAFVGDDTGLLKQVKIQAKCTVINHAINYGEKNRKRMRLVTDEEGKKVEVEARPGKLNSSDNQVRREYETSVKFKLLGRYGEQVKHEGLECMSWTLGSIGKKDDISLIKGTSNKACIFNTSNESVSHSKDYSDLFSQVSAKLKGLHPIPQPDDSAKTTKHVLVSNKGHILIDAIGIKKLPKKQSLAKINGDDVWKSFQSDFDPAVIAIC